MNNRIIWIDWAKAIGIMIVVYFHVPQEDSFFKTFLCSFQMPLFFLVSGFLYKAPQVAFKYSIKKYWRTLIVPYILFQFICYPYWLIQRSVQDGHDVSNYMESVISPFAQCLWGVPIDGITWFIFALLITKIIADVSLRCTMSTIIVILLCLGSMIGAWFIWQDDKLNITFAIDSLFNFFPFFFIGFLFKKRNIIREDSSITCVAKSLIYFVVSYIIICHCPNNYLSQRIAFYILGLTGSLFIIYLCKLPLYIPNIIKIISIGSIIILGLHWMFIGTTNYFLEKYLHIQDGIKYSIPESIFLVLIITILNSGIIKLCQKHFKALLGYR